MLLIVTATDLEMAPIDRRLAGQSGWTPLVAGIGCLETAVCLTRFLSRNNTIRAIINCGVAGAFVGAGPGLLDICLAETETLPEAGVLLADGVHPLDTIRMPTQFVLDPTLLSTAMTTLVASGVNVWSGPFVSVLAVSGTLARGNELRSRHGALCENMEGAAVARVAQAFSIPCLEVRAVSNMVEDRDVSAWRLPEAIERCAEAVASLLPGLSL